MEDFVGNMKSRGTTLRNDRNARMAQPPRSYNRLYEDFGSDFGSSSRKGASNGTKNTNTHKALQDFDTSIDELDFLSQHSSDVEVSSPRKSSQTGTSKALKEGGFWIDGVYHEPAKGFEADGRAKLKGLKFKKNKSTASNASQDATTPSSSTAKRVPTGVTSRPPSSNSLNKPFRTPGFVNKGEGPSRPAPPISRPPTPPQTPDWFHDVELEDTPRPPKPRPKAQTASSSLGIKRVEDEPTRTSVKGKTKATAADFPMELPLKETSNSKPKPGPSQRPIKAPFPLDTLSSSSSKGENVKESGPKKRRPASPPFSKQSSQEPWSSKRDVPDEATIGSLERKKKQPARAPFEDMISGSSQEPRGSASRKRVDRSPEEIPPLSPPSSSSTRASTTKGSKPKPKLKAKVSKGTIYSSEDTEDDSTRPKARPFPMATQMFAAVEPSSAKRGSSSPISDPDSDGTGERRGRKRARGADEIMRELMYSDGLDGEEDEAALFMDPDLDPNRLCPWCDELLPPAPSPHLQHLIDIARNRSVKDARPTNPLGLHAAPTVFINVCQRHRFERNQIPLAQERGWPTQIEWSKLGSRVRRQRHFLQRLVDDVDEEFLPGNERQREEAVKEGEEDAQLARDDESLLATRPRKGSAFWIEVVRNVRRKGAQKAAGVRGQMSNFSKIQPGYYGELGSVIISQTIYDLFPPASFPANSTLPLTPAEFIQGILVPEAALALVMEDMDQTRAEALRTLRESAQYGVAMFPDDAQEGNSASEAIVKARAAARREELLREEQREAEEEDALWGAFSDPTAREVEVAPQSSQASIDRPRRECARRTAPIVESSDDDSDVSMASTRSKKPRSKKPVSQRQAKAKAAESGADVLELSDTPEFSKPPSRATAKARSKAASEAASEVMEISDASSSAKPRPKPRPRTKTGAYDTDTKTSDIEAPSSSNPGLAAPVVTFGARGEMQKRVRREDGTIKTIDLERTPKAKKRVTSGSKSFGLKIIPVKTRATSRPPTDNEWSRNLYKAKYSSSDDL